VPSTQMDIHTHRERDHGAVAIGHIYAMHAMQSSNMLRYFQPDSLS